MAGLPASYTRFGIGGGEGLVHEIWVLRRGGTFYGLLAVSPSPSGPDAWFELP